MDPTNRNTALASAMAEELARCGVERAVVSPGSRSTPLAVALWRQEGIEVTVILDERSAGFFALAPPSRPASLLRSSALRDPPRPTSTRLWSRHTRRAS